MLKRCILVLDKYSFSWTSLAVSHVPRGVMSGTAESDIAPARGGGISETSIRWRRAYGVVRYCTVISEGIRCANTQ